MTIYPAIDIRQGRCVRLRQGDYNCQTVYADDPLAVARRWHAAGAQWLHVVDLDGAKNGEPANTAIIRQIVQEIPISVQVGGGFRSTDAVAEAIASGVQTVVVGTRAVREPAWLQEIALRWPQRIVLGLDARDGWAAVEGWQETAAVRVTDFLQQLGEFPLAAIVYTDIRRDGMLSGPNYEALAAVVAASPWPVIASGGIATLEDIHRLRPVGVAGCIIGRALYEGTIQLESALAAAGAPPAST